MSYDTCTLQSLHDSCFANIRDAAKLEAEHRALMARLPPGDVRIVGTKDVPPLRYQILALQYEQAHWREYQAHYRGRMEREGRDKQVRIIVPERLLAKGKHR